MILIKIIIYQLQIFNKTIYRMSKDPMIEI